jgi:glycosyl transferase family 2
MERALIYEGHDRRGSVPELVARAESTTKDVSEILDWAFEKRLLRKVARQNGRRYEITSSGWRFLEDYQNIRSDFAGVKLSFTSENGRLLSLTPNPRRLRQLYEVMKPTITIVIPTMNEADNLGEVLRDIQKHFEHRPGVLIVDGSDDHTPTIGTRLGAKVVRQHGRGKGRALIQAFDAVEGDIIVMMDGDGSMTGQEIRNLTNTMILSGAEIAKGSRFMLGGGSDDISLIRKIGNSVFVSLVNMIWRAEYTDLCYGFLAIRRDALEKLKPHLVSKHFEIETEILIKAKKFGVKTIEVPSFERKRQYGSSKLSSLRDSMRIFIAIMRETFP